MIVLIESVVLCAIFTLMVFIMSRKPINTLYNYPPRIQERVKSLDEYKDDIPTQVNVWDAIVLDIIWFCHDPHFVFIGTEDMVDDYHDYWFHIKGFFIGEGLALVVCVLSGLVVHFIL